MTAAPSFLDLFSGIGGLSLGLMAAGLRCVGGVDNWAEARATFEYNHDGARLLLADLTVTSAANILHHFGADRDRLDVVVGGPPCQGFSTVGKRDAADPRNRLWTAFRDIVRDVRPAYVVIENVEGLLVMQGGRVRDEIAASFAEIGYGMKCKLLRSADYGVPQLRKRAVFLGWLAGLAEPRFPAPLRTPPVTVADAISDLPELGPGEARTEYDRPPATDYQRARRAGATALHNHEAANHPPALVEVLSHIPDGGNRKSIPDRLQPKSGFHNSYARLASWKPAVAVTSNMRKPSSARATHPTQHRGLTVREGLRLQSFDDTFVVLGPRSSQYLQVGNAVPPLLGRAIGAELLRALRANPPRAVRDARRGGLTRVTAPRTLFDAAG
ncbi:MAG: DNA cytosine methyltransferase [Gemmataceae bacterium]|nr:DNA cytosine methyltransferase [Gemmataceae bacterium]